ncbi:MAG: tetratricopeptide repeat protein [Paracoccaceae bacterium]
MTIRRIAIFLSIVAISLFVFNIYNKPNPAVAICINRSLPADKIIAACTKLVETPDVSAKNLAYLLLKRSRAFRRLRDYENAIADLDRALVLKPDYSYAWIHKAYNHIAAGDRAAADSAFEAALALDPDSIFTLIQRAKLYYAKGYYEQAQQDYERVLKYDPENSKAWLNIANMIINRGNFDVAIEWLNQAAIALPDEPQIYESLGSLYLLHRKDLEKSLWAFSRLETLRPDYEATQLWLGATQLRLGEESLGKEHIERFTALFDQNSSASGGLISSAIIDLGTDVLLGESTLFMYRGIAYGALDRPDISRIEFEKFVVEGGAFALKLLKDIMAESGYCVRRDCGDDLEGQLGTALDEYIKSLEGGLSLKLTGDSQ